MFRSPYRSASGSLLGTARACTGALVCVAACVPGSPPGDHDVVLSEGSDSSSASSSEASSSSGDGPCGACELDAVICINAGVATCIEVAGCLRWSEPEPCLEGQICTAGTCVTHQGFRNEITDWSVPAGGHADAGFYIGSGEPAGVGDDNWNLLDLDGDGTLDLVITARAHKSGDTFVTRTQGYPNAPFWEIYRGRSEGFTTSPSAWVLPLGVGLLERGLVSLEGAPLELADNGWALRDLNGDHKPDLIVTARGDFDGVVLPLGTNDAPRWDVYFNEGKGFAESPTPLMLPPGPDALNFVSLQGATPGTKGLIWSLADLNGDRRQDLVISGRPYGSGFATPGFPVSPRWDVHLGTEAGGLASEASAWVLPKGGALNAGFVGGLAGLTSTGTLMGDQLWSLLDLGGSEIPELVITGTLFNEGPEVFDADATPHWRVFHVQGTGFDPSYEEFLVPTEGGGSQSRGFYALRGGQDTAGSLATPFDTQGWELLDLDGDHRLDLVITNEIRIQDSVYTRRAIGGPEDPRWDVYFGTTAGFITAEFVPMPVGGIAGRGFLWSRGQVSPVPQVEGSVLWEMGDLDGDDTPELIVTANAIAREGSNVRDWCVPGKADDTPHWKLHRQAP